MCQSLRQRVASQLHYRLWKFQTLQQIVDGSVELLGMDIGRNAEHLYRICALRLDIEAERSKIYGILLNQIELLLGEGEQFREEQLLRHRVSALQRCGIVLIEQLLAGASQIHNQQFRGIGYHSIATTAQRDIRRLLALLYRQVE